MPSNLQERDFAGTPYVPVYVLLPVSPYSFDVVPLKDLLITILSKF